MEVEEAEGGDLMLKKRNLVWSGGLPILKISLVSPPPLRLWGPLGLVKGPPVGACGALGAGEAVGQLAGEVRGPQPARRHEATAPVRPLESEGGGGLVGGSTSPSPPPPTPSLSRGKCLWDHCKRHGDQKKVMWGRGNLLTKGRSSPCDLVCWATLSEGKSKGNRGMDRLKGWASVLQEYSHPSVYIGRKVILHGTQEDRINKWKFFWKKEKTVKKNKSQ